MKPQSERSASSSRPDKRLGKGVAEVVDAAKPQAPFIAGGPAPMWDDATIDQANEMLTTSKDSDTLTGIESGADFDPESGEPTTEQYNREGEFLDMQSANLLEGGGGGGGLYGQDKDVILRNHRFAEHAFEKKDKVTGAVTEKFGTSTMLGVDIYVIDRAEDEPEFQSQWYPVGQLPARRLQELKEKFDPKNPGGYQPSTDNENPANEGPFVVLDGKQDIWINSPYMQLMEEYKQLGLMEHAERFAAQGVACLNETRVHLGSKALPKSKKAQQDEQLTGTSKQARTILVPTQIHQWGWEAGQQATTTSVPAAAAKPATTAAPKAAAPKPAAAATTTVAAKPAAAGNGGGDVAPTPDEQTAVAEYVQKAITAANGTLKKANLPMKLLPLMAKVDGKRKSPLLQLANSDDFLNAGNGALWNYDAESGTLTAVS